MDNTPKGMWDAMFANRMKENSPSTVGAMPFGEVPTVPTKPPVNSSLSALAAGGQNHAQKWMAEAAANSQPDRQKQFSWSPQFQT